MRPPMTARLTILLIASAMLLAGCGTIPAPFG